MDIREYQTDMHKFKKMAVIIPALNEEATVGAIVKEVVRLGCDVYVINDDSSDDTAIAARHAGATVLSLPYTAGAWNAIQAGMLYARKKGKYEFFVTMDADGQHLPDNIVRLLNGYKGSDENVVIGSCASRGGFSRQLAWLFFTLCTQLKIHDVTSGFRLYDRIAVEALLSWQASMLDYQDLGVLLFLRNNAVNMKEIQVSMRPRQNGKSRVFGNWRDVVKYIAITCGWVFSDWVSGPSCSPSSWTDYDII